MAGINKYETMIPWPRLKSHLQYKLDATDRSLRHTGVDRLWHLQALASILEDLLDLPAELMRQDEADEAEAAQARAERG